MVVVANGDRETDNASEVDEARYRVQSYQVLQREINTKHSSLQPERQTGKYHPRGTNHHQAIQPPGAKNNNNHRLTLLADVEHVRNVPEA